MSELPTAATLGRSVWHDFREARRALVIFEVLFKLAEAWLLVPAAAFVLAAVLSRAGHIAVSNQDILDFLLTPTGVLYAALSSIAVLALILFEQAGVMVLSVRPGTGHPPSRQALRAALRKSLGIVQLGAVMAALLALAMVPFILLAVLTFSTLLSEHDIYFYLKERPPIFWVAASIGVLLLLGALAVVAWLYVRWALALPILLFEDQFPCAALRASTERARGAGWRIGFFLVGWLVGMVLLGVVVEAGFRLLAAAVLAATGDRILVLSLLLLTQGMLLASLSCVLVIGLGLVTRRLYLHRSEQPGLERPDSWGKTPEEKPASPWNGRLGWLSLLLFLLAPLALWTDLAAHMTERPLVRVTAHRGHARAAPENTISSIRKAIASGADYAEVDVHQTADGTVVLLHDRDLKRVAGVSRRLDELSFDAVRQLDVGSWFDPAFAGERVPTLEEAVNLCRGRIKMNIELKFFGRDRRLVPEVARILRAQDFESECLVTSLNYDALLELKQHNPRLRTGFTVAHALGDINGLEIDALSVRADFLSDELLRSAHRRGREVHAWTVNDAAQMTRLVKRGVDNLITSDPDLGVEVRDKWAALTGPERLVLASRLLLGLEP